MIETIRDHADGKHPLLDHVDCPVCEFTLQQRQLSEIKS